MPVQGLTEEERLRQLQQRAQPRTSPPVLMTSGIAEGWVDVPGQAPAVYIPPSGVAESQVSPPTKTVVIGARGHPEERLQALIDVAPYVPISGPTFKTVVLGARGKAEQRYMEEYNKWISTKPPSEPIYKEVLVGGRGRFEERISVGQPDFYQDIPNYFDIRDKGLQAFVKQWAGAEFVTEGRYANQINKFIYSTALSTLKFAQRKAFTASVESWEFYNRLGFPQYGSKYSPFTIPSGMKVFEIAETPSGLAVKFMPFDMTREEFLLFQKIEDVKAAGRQEFYEGIGYGDLAQKYESFIVPEGYRVETVKETAEGLSVAFKSLVEAPQSLSEQLYGGKVPSLGLRQSMLGDLDRYLVVGKPVYPYKLVAGFVGSFESVIYSVGRLVGVQGLPEPPVTALGGAISSGIETILGKEGVTLGLRKVFGDLDKYTPFIPHQGIKPVVSQELQEVFAKGPEYTIGTILGDVALSWLFSKAIQKAGSMIAEQIEPTALKGYSAESYAGFQKGQLAYEGKLSFSKFATPSESGESILGRLESWVLRRTRPELAVGQVSIPTGEVWKGGQYLIRPESLAATDIGWGLIEAPRMGGIMVTKVPTETVLKGLPVYFGLGTELLSSGMAYEETFMFKGGKEATTKPFETVKPLGGFEKLPYTMGYEGPYSFQRGILPTTGMLLKEPAQRSALEIAFLKQFLTEPFTGSVTHSYAWAYWLSKTYLETFPRQTLELPRTLVAKIESSRPVQKQAEKLAGLPLFVGIVEGFIPAQGQLNLVKYAGQPYPGTARYAEEWAGYELLHYPGEALTPQKLESGISVSKVTAPIGIATGKVSPTSTLIQDVWIFDRELQRHWIGQAQKQVVPLEQQVKQLPIQIGTSVVTPDVKAFESLKEFDRAILLPRVFVSGRYKPVETAIPISGLEVMQKQAAKLVQVRGLQRGFYGGIPEGRPRPPSKFLPEESEFKKRFGMKAKKMLYPYRRYERFWPVMTAKQAMPYLFGKSTTHRKKKR